MAHAWWRDDDYDLFARLTKERDEAKAALEAERAKVAVLEKENAALLYAFPEYGATGNELREERARADAAEAKVAALMEALQQLIDANDECSDEAHQRMAHASDEALEQAHQRQDRLSRKLREEDLAASSWMFVRDQRSECSDEAPSFDWEAARAAIKKATGGEP